MSRFDPPSLTAAVMSHGSTNPASSRAQRVFSVSLWKKTCSCENNLKRFKRCYRSSIMIVVKVRGICDLPMPCSFSLEINDRIYLHSRIIIYFETTFRPNECVAMLGILHRCCSILNIQILSLPQSQFWHTKIACARSKYRTAHCVNVIEITMQRSSTGLIWFFLRWPNSMLFVACRVESVGYKIACWPGRAVRIVLLALKQAMSASLHAIWIL